MRDTGVLPGRQHQHYPRIPRVTHYLCLTTYFHYLFPLPIADCKRSLLDTYFLYIYLLISIDLQLSCSVNSHTLQSLQKEWREGAPEAFVDGGREFLMTGRVTGL